MTPIVLGIAGADRSGTTLLDSILGGYPDVFSAGELSYFWERGLVHGRLCGCGVPVNECPVWDAVCEVAWLDGIDWQVMARSEQLLRSRRSFDPLIPGLRARYMEGLAEVAREVGPVYRAICEVTGAGVVVDSSKRPTWMHLLASIPDIDLRIVHMVRDPRAVAHSRRRFKRQVDDNVERGMTQHASANSAFFWDMWNLAIEMFERPNVPILRLRYEDLMDDPVTNTERVAAFAGLSDVRHPNLTPTSVEMATAHTVSGNPSRFELGHVGLKNDDSWTRDQSMFDRMTVTGLTAPIALRYGYPLRVRSGSSGRTLRMTTNQERS